MKFFQVVNFVLVILGVSRGCPMKEKPTREKPTDVIEGSGDTDPVRHRTVIVNPLGYLPTDDLGSLTGLRPGDLGQMHDRATKQEFYPPRAKKIDLDNKSDEDGTDGFAAAKRSGNGEKDQGMILGGSDSLLTGSENDRHPHQAHFVSDTVSLMEQVRSSQSASVPSLPESQDGSVSTEHLSRELAQIRSPSREVLPGLSTADPSGASSQPALPSLLPEFLAAEPTSPAAEAIPNIQRPGLSTSPVFVVQDPGASLIMKQLPPELLMYLQTLGTSVEGHLLEEFRSIGFSMGPHEEGQQMSHPKYRTICSSGDVQVRSYRRSTWISTTVNTSSFDVATYIGFHRLFKYIQGENSRGGKLDMAKPVRTQVLPEPATQETRGGGDRYKVSFYASRKRDVDLPTPLDRRIFIEELRPSRFYALTFGGFPISQRVDEQALRLDRLLPNSNRNQSEQLGSSFFVDVYDTPMKLTDRHNEVLIPLGIADSPRHWCSNPGPADE